MTALPPIRVGILGCGMIAHEYAVTLAASDRVALTACADARPEAARAFAARHVVPTVVEPARMLSPALIDLLVILTPPNSHHHLAHAAIDAEIPAVYLEKPLTLSPETATDLITRAAARNVALAAAPDTILGPPTQTARALIDAGQLGEIVGAHAAYHSPGPEIWHPSPEPFHAPGIGPLADMGPYYLTTLTYLLGPVSRVLAAHATLRPQRTIATGPRAGQRFTAHAPTYVSTLLELHRGVPATFTASFDTPGTRAPHLEIHGTRAVLALPDPNFHNGELLLRAVGSRQWQPIAQNPPLYPVTGRGIGVLELATHFGNEGQLACSAHAAAHLVYTIAAIHHSASTGNNAPASPTHATTATDQ
jgi:predicted dehydrogenase